MKSIRYGIAFVLVSLIIFIIIKKSCIPHHESKSNTKVIVHTALSQCHDNAPKNTIQKRFEKCLKPILVHEGGLSNDKGDPGGITNWGISLRYLRSIGYDFNKDGKINDEDIIGLPLSGAEKIYKKYWWDAYKYNCFKEDIVLEKVFDMAVNMGGHQAHKLLQIAINHLLSKPIEVDGDLGPQTFSAANSVDANALRAELRKCSKKFYNEILAENPSMEWARKGWLNRAAW